MGMKKIYTLSKKYKRMYVRKNLALFYGVWYTVSAQRKVEI